MAGQAARITDVQPHGVGPWIDGLIGVFIFSASLVATRLALARGGIAAIGQLQLLQPFLGLGVAALVLGERIEPAMIGAAAAMALCVALARRFA